MASAAWRHQHRKSGVISAAYRQRRHRSIAAHHGVFMAKYRQRHQSAWRRGKHRSMALIISAKHHHIGGIEAGALISMAAAHQASNMK